MVEIHPVERVGPLPAVEKAERDERRKRQNADLHEKKKTEPADSRDSPPHVDEYA